jgi:toxin ParE1/3/4
VTARYTIRALAKTDLEEIWFYTYQEWGSEQADNYLKSLLSCFTRLAENPSIGKKRDDIKTGYYCFPEGAHNVFYTITSQGIDIIGIPHQRMDIINYMNDI